MNWLDKGPGRMSFTRQQREEAIRICRDTDGGTLLMRERKETYLPMFPKETSDVYDARVRSAVLFNVVKQTKNGLSGMVHRKPPTPDDQVPEAIVEHFGDIDRAGRNLSTFSNDTLSEALLDGLSIIVTDMPRIDPEATRDELGDARPYWFIIKGEDVLGFEHERRAGVDVVTSLRWRDQMIQRGMEDDPFEEVAVPQVKQFRLVSATEEGGQTQNRVEWRAWRLEQPKQGERRWVDDGAPELMGTQMDEIPISVVYTNRKGVLDAEPPLLDLAAENVRHYQKSSDKDNAEHVACVSIFCLKGVDPDEVKDMAIGPTVGVVLPSKDADAKYVETTGEGASITAESLKASEHRMALLGLSMLHSESRAAETATSKQIDKSESDSRLGLAADSLEQALNNARRLHAKWLGLEDAGAITVNRDFQNIPMDAQMVTALAALVPEKLSLDTFWELMRQGEILPDTFDADVERERLSEQDMTMLAKLRQLMAEAPPDPAAAGAGAGG